MSASDLLFAAMLLSAPIGTPEPPPPADHWPAVRDALHRTAVEWEILDPREVRYVLAKRDDFQEDLDFLRKRKAEFAEAPKVLDAHRLPGREMINDAVRFNRSLHKHLERRAAWEADRAGLFREVIDENERLYRIWDAMRDAKSDLHYVTTRRKALLRLRDHIGPDAYLLGDYPPFAPDWRLARLP